MRWMKKYTFTNKRQGAAKAIIWTNCTRALKSVFLRQVTPVPCFSVCVSPRNMGMPWAYVSKGPADTVRNSALIDEIFRKAGMKPRATVTPAPEPYGKLLSKL